MSLTRVRAVANCQSAFIYNPRADPFERGTGSINCGDWRARRIFLIGTAGAARWLSSFKEFPRQKPARFNLDKVTRKMTEHPVAVRIRVRNRVGAVPVSEPHRSLSEMQTCSIVWTGYSIPSP